MAYVFNAVNDSLQDKANIFGGSAVAGGGEDAQQNANVFQTSAPVTGSTAGGGSSSSGGSAAMQGNKKGSGSGGSYNPAAAQKAYDAVGAGNFKPATDKIQGSVASSGQKLQDEANAYTTKADTTAAGYKVDDATLGKAADGDNTAYSTVAGRLSKAAPDQFEAFAGLGTDEIPTAANAVSKPSLFGDIYRPTAGADLTNGQNSLNSMQLRRSGEFRNIAQQLGAQQETVLSDNAKMQDELTDSTREKLNTAYTTETDSAKSKLNAMGETIITSAKDQEAADELRRQGLDPATLSKTEFDKLKPQILQGLQAAGLNRSTGYLDDPNNFAELSKYLTIDKDVDYTDFIDQSGADKYNRINGLLGNGSSIIAPTARDDDYSFDTNGAQSYIGTTIQGKRQADDRALQSQIDAIQAQATQRNSSFTENPYQDAQNYVRERYLNQNEGQTAQQIAAEQETFRQLFNPDVKGFDTTYKAQGGLQDARKTGNWQDSLSTQEAQQLTALAQQLGQDTQYKQGSLQNPGYDPTFFNNLFDKNYSRISGEINGTTSRTTGGGMDRTTTVNPTADEAEIARVKAKYPWLGIK